MTTINTEVANRVAPDWAALEEIGRGGRPRPSYCYVISMDLGPNSLIKIGWSIDPWRRLAELRQVIPHPLALISLVAGGREMERELHTDLAEYRYHGEWFRATNEVYERLRTVFP